MQAYNIPIRPLKGGFENLESNIVCFKYMSKPHISSGPHYYVDLVAQTRAETRYEYGQPQVDLAENMWKLAASRHSYQPDDDHVVYAVG